MKVSEEKNILPDAETDAAEETGAAGEVVSEEIGTSLSGLLNDMLKQQEHPSETLSTHNGRPGKPKEQREKRQGRNVIEREFVKATCLAGGVAYPVDRKIYPDFPEYLVLFLHGKSAFVIFRIPGRNLQPSRIRRMKQIQALGFPVIGIDHLEQIIPVLEAVMNWRRRDPFPEGIGAKMPELRDCAGEKAGAGKMRAVGFEEGSAALFRQIQRLHSEADAELWKERDLEAQVKAAFREMQRKQNRRPINRRCEFHDVNDRKDICMIGMDVEYCSEDCAFATTNPLSTPPYGSRYIKGRL